MDDDKFRQLKQAIKQTGMLTANGVKQVLLSPSVERDAVTAKSAWEEKNACTLVPLASGRGSLSLELKRTSVVLWWLNYS